jgi:hypothetical protein
MCFQSQALNFLFYLGRAVTALRSLQLSVVKSYSDVATLTWQRTEDMFREFPQFS